VTAFSVFRFVGAALPLFLVGALQAAQPTIVKVEKQRPRIERRTFDPKNPPPTMPTLAPTEAAVCAYQFECSTELGVEMPGSAVKTITATINSSKIYLGLSIIIWTPENAPAALRDHEEAHRKICEIYYQDADETARVLAENVIGKKLTVAVKNQDAALQDLLRKVQGEVLAAFMAKTAAPCEFAEKRFDVITAHGVNPISNDDATAQALAEEKARRAK
jgi:hypothetical protein